MHVDYKYNKIISCLPYLYHFISMSNLNFEYTYLNYTCMYINPNPLKNHRNLNLIKIGVEAYIIENMEKQEQNH